MDEYSKEKNELIISYLILRKIIGYLGIFLPLVLFLGAVILFNTGLQNSLSSYYHTDMGDVFVATLCVIGFFLFSYKGYEPKDDKLGDWGGFFAIGTGLLPTAPENSASSNAIIIGYAHFAFAAFFFFTLIYFALKLFTKTKDDEPAKGNKLKRNKIYKFCAYTMIISILLMLIFFFLPDSIKNVFEPYNPIFWLESATIMAFAFSWLVKGETLLTDDDETAGDLDEN